MATDDDIKKALEDSTAATKNLAEAIAGLKSGLVSINANIASLSLNDSVVELKKGINDPVAITALNSSILELKEAGSTQTDALDKLNESVGKLKKDNDKEETGFLGAIKTWGKGGKLFKNLPWVGVIVRVIQPLTTALIFLKDTIMGSFATFGKMSGRFAAIGGNMNILNSTLSESVVAYGSNLTGFTNTMETQIAALGAGTSANNKGMQRLGQQLKATGQSQDRVFGTLAQFNIGARVSVEAQDALASHIVGLSENFGVKSEVLADALKKTGGDLKALGALFGTSIDIQRQIVNLTAAAGPAGAGIAGEFLSTITKGSNILSRAFLGVQEAANNMIRGGDAIDVTVTAGLRAEKMFGRISKSSGALLFQFDVLNKMVPGARQAMLVLGEMRKRAKEAEETLEVYTARIKKEQVVRETFTKSLAALKERLFDPLKVLGFKLLEAVERWIEKNTKFLDGIGLSTAKLLKMDKVFDKVVAGLFSLGKAFVVLGRWVASIVSWVPWWSSGPKAGEESMSDHLENMVLSFDEAKKQFYLISENTAALREIEEKKEDKVAKHVVDTLNDTLITLLPVLDSIKDNTEVSAEKESIIVLPTGGLRPVPEPGGK